VKLLIVRLSSLGDVVHTLPLAENAHAAGATVGWLVERRFAGLLDGNPHCTQIFAADTKGWRRRPFASATRAAISSLGRALQAFAADQTIDTQGLWKSAVLARWAGAPVVGFGLAERREPASTWLCSIRVRPAADLRHIVDRNLALLSPAGIPVRVRAPDAGYLLSQPSAAADAFLAAVPRPFAMFHAGAGHARKAWGKERFVRLAQGLLRERGLFPVLSWGPGDERRVARLRALLPEASVPPMLDIVGLAHVMRASALLAAGDTGPLHLADALGVPTLALFGPTDPERNGPYRNRSGVVARMGSASDEDVLARARSVCR
jgi:heptosyltransferase-1